MSVITWRGDAMAVAQVDTNVIGGTWATNDILTATCNGKSVSFVVGASHGIEDVIAGFVAAWSASTVAEHTEITAADANPNITLTANYAGMPFTVTWAKTSTSGTISASTTTTNAGPANVQASNFSAGALPTNGDTLVFENSKRPCLYNLEALAALTTLMIIVKNSFTGTIGLPLEHTVASGDGYAEYRPRYVKAGLTALMIEGDGPGSGRLMFDAAASTPTVTIDARGSGADRNSGIPAVLIKNTGSASVFYFNRGSLGLAIFAGETGAGKVEQGYVSSQAGDTTLVTGSGFTFVTEFHQTGGTATVESNIPTVIQDAGQLTVNGTATVGHSEISGTVFSDSSGAWSDMTIRRGGKFDKRQSMVAQTINDPVYVDDGGEFHDPYQLTTRPGGLVADPTEAVLDIGTYVLIGSGA